MIPVNVITGFLGSGKTTLLREVLNDPAFSDTAVIVNEFGEVGLDHLLLQQVDEGVLLLDSGCICCTIRSDLQETIRDLQASAASGKIPSFRRVVVETTGLADPAPIVSTISADPIIRNHFRIGNIICTVDGMNGMQTVKRHEEAEKQLAVADRVLLTKADLVDEQAISSLKGIVGQINPVAPVTLTRGEGFDAEKLFGVDIGQQSERFEETKSWFSSPQTANHNHTSRTTSFVLTYDKPIDWTAFGVWLTSLLHAHGNNILRVKGILVINESDMPVVIHGVQHVMHPPLHLDAWPSGDKTSRIVFIVRDIDPERIKRSLHIFLKTMTRLTSPSLEMETA